MHAAAPLTVRAADGRVVLALHGPVVAGGSAAAVSAWSLQRLPSCTRELVLDLSGVAEVDAVGLGALLALRRRVRGTVVVVGAGRQVRSAVARAGASALLPEVDAAETLAA